MANARENDGVRLANSLKATTSAVQRLLFDRRGERWNESVLQPKTFLDLAVSGAETKPGTTVRAEWNRKCSSAFLSAAVDGYASEGTDEDGETGTKSRTLRFRVIQVMGGDVSSVVASTYTYTGSGKTGAIVFEGELPQRATGSESAPCGSAAADLTRHLPPRPPLSPAAGTAERAGALRASSSLLSAVCVRVTERRENARNGVHN